jgi:hypothetical protein
MSKVTPIIVLLLLCISHLPVSGQPPALTDAELDTVGAGFDFCGFFSIKGSCVASSLQAFTPGSDPVLTQTAIPGPFASTVTLTHEFTTGTGAFGQSLSQSNTFIPGLPPTGPVFLDRGTDLAPTSLLMRTAPVLRP